LNVPPHRKLSVKKVEHVLRRPAGWRAGVIAVALGAFLVRLLIIAHSHGGADLRIYTYFSRLALHGLNPFALQPNEPIPLVDANSPPLEVAAFAALLAIHDSPTTLRVAFALADVAVVLLIGLRFPRPRRWRAAFIVFYAFNPFVLFSWTVFAEDKTLLFLGIAAWVLALERGREWTAWAAATALTVFKFLGAFAVPALALHSFRTRRWRALAPIGASLGIFLLSNLPWFPKSLDAFTRRDARLALNPPIHESPTLLLSRLGIYAPIEAKLLTAVAIVTVLGFFAARRIDICEAVVWSLFAGYVFLPDDPFNRLLLITLPFMLILDFSIARWIAIWVVSSVAALAGVVATRGVPHELSAIAGALRTLFAHEETVRLTLWMNLLPALVLAFYFADRRSPRTRARPIAMPSARPNPSTTAS
jgi:hypothetical protein